MPKKLNQDEALNFWREIHKKYKRKNEDTLNLTLSCLRDQSLKINKFLDKVQNNVFQEFLKIAFKNKSSKLTALDIGCGGGRWLLRLKKRKFKVWGIDISKKTINFLKKDKRFKNIIFKISPFQKIKLKENSFDFILSVTVIHHIPYSEHKKIFKKILKALKPGGYFFLLESIKKDPLPQIFSRDIEEWKKLAKNSGFDVIKTRLCLLNFSLKLLQKLEKYKLDLNFVYNFIYLLDLLLSKIFPKKYLFLQAGFLFKKPYNKK